MIIIVGYARDIIFVLKTAMKQGMNNGHFAFITQEFIQADLNKEDNLYKKIEESEICLGTFSDSLKNNLVIPGKIVEAM